MEYFISRAQASEVESKAIDEGSSVSVAIYQANLAMHKNQGTLVQEGFVFLGNLDTEAFVVKKGGEVVLNPGTAEKIAKAGKAKFETLVEGPDWSLMDDPEGVVAFRSVDMPGLDLDEVGRGLLVQAEE